MMRNIIIIFFFFFFCISVLSAGAAPSLQELTIYYSNDVRGEIEPCG